MRRKLVVGFLVFILFLASFLRFYQLDTIPHGLYIDEVSIGYNAYSILTKGVDEHGVAYPLFFRAFGEYKMPVEIYLTSLSMAVFGKNELAVRFPSALLGTLTVLLIYFLVRNLFILQKTKQDNAESVSLLSAFFLAISPWHIQFSRGGFEANIALFFYLLGGVSFLQYVKGHRYRWLFLSVLSFIVTAYTYNAYKLIAPVTLLFVLLKSFNYLNKSHGKFVMTVLFLIVLLLPLLLFSEGSSRFLMTSAFSDYTGLSLLQQIFLYPMVYLQNYFSFFSLSVLFATGDGFGRHTIVGMGPLFRFELPLLLVGFFVLFRERKTFFAQVIVFLMLVAPMTAALTQPSPHLLRSLLLVIPLTILTAYGLVVVWNSLRRQRHNLFRAARIVFGLVALFEFYFYLHLYYVHYPMRTAADWGLGHKEIVLAASQAQKEYSKIIINKKVGISSSYINFYNDELVYEIVDITWQRPKDYPKKILYITTFEEAPFISSQDAPHKHLRDIRLPNANNDVVAGFWEI